MKKLTILSLFNLSFLVTVSAQDIKNWVDSKKPLLFEKLYLHVDREFYAPGDNIWIKVYQVNGITNQLNSNFRNIFVQLISEEGKIVQENILFSIKGQARCEFKTESLKSGLYTIRAFTRYLENFGEDASFHKKIWITKLLKTVDLTENSQPDYSKIDVKFLPEGGSLVLNVLNMVAFKAIDSKGKGIYVSGKILSELGDTISSFSTRYMGMGKFVMMPEDGETYFATIDQCPEMKIPIDQAKSEGISLNYTENADSLTFEMSGNSKLPRHPDFYFAASHKGIVLFYKKLEMHDFAKKLQVGKNQFPKGISKISLLDTSLIQIAERLIFVDDGKDDLLRLQLTQKEFKPREEVKIEIEALLQPGDSVNSTLSVAVVNKNYFCASGNSQNIKSYLLLDSDLKGAIESPASYFISDELHSSSEKIDLLMMVNGWSSYLWDDIAAAKKSDLNDWNDAGIEIKGLVKKLLFEKPVPEAQVVLGPSSGNSLFEKTTADLNGRFKFERIYLRDSTLVTLNAKTKGGSKFTEIRLDPIFQLDSTVSPFLMKTTSFDIELNRKFIAENSNRSMKEMGFNPEKGSILLSDVDIIEKRILKDDGHFRIYSAPDNSLTVSEADYTYTNVFDYLEGKVPGLTVNGDQISIRGGGTPLFLLDGMEVSDFPPGSGSDVREIRNIHMSEIEKVEILKSGVNMSIFGSKGGNGVIAIYRKTTDPNHGESRYIKGRITQRIKGFYRERKFYSPKYTLENIHDEMPDYRPTLFWNPDLGFVNGKSSIDFFTSDDIGQYLVFVEGISKNGKICFGTSSFKVNKKIKNY